MHVHACMQYFVHMSNINVANVLVLVLHNHGNVQVRAQNRTHA